MKSRVRERLAAATKSVPRPGGRNYRAFQKFRVYQITYRERGRTQIWKYGITMQIGDRRKNIGVGLCKAVKGACSGRYISNQMGYYAARAVEYGHIVGYKLRTGKCPPGQPSCK